MPVSVNSSMSADTIQGLIDSNPTGTVFNFAAGTYTLNHYLVMKDGNQMISTTSRGAILTGLDTYKGAIAGEFGSTNQVIRGFVVEHFISDGSFPIAGLQIRDGGLIEDCEVRYCLNGIHVQASNTIRGCYVHHNGQYGIEGGPGNTILIENTEMSWNNTLHMDPNIDAGGSKIVGSTAGSDGVTWRNNWVHDNYGSGIWSDGNVINALYEGNRCENNGGPGINHEISWAATIRNNILQNNNTLTTPVSIWSGGEIALNNSQNVEIYGNYIYTNNNAISLVNSTRSEPIQFPQSLASINVHNNDVWFRGAVFSGFSGDSSPSGVTFTANNYHTDTLARWQDMSGVRTFAQWKSDGFDVAGANGPYVPVSSWGSNMQDLNGNVGD